MEGVQHHRLRHPQDERRFRRDLVHANGGDAFSADEKFEALQFEMRISFEELEKPELFHHLHETRHEHLTAVLALEIRMLFQKHRADASGRKHQRQDHPGGTTAGHHDVRFYDAFNGHSSFFSNRRSKGTQKAPPAAK